MLNQDLVSDGLLALTAAGILPALVQPDRLTLSPETGIRLVVIQTNARMT